MIRDAIILCRCGDLGILYAWGMGREDGTL